jgi:putative ABC transport system ATP-binding protein
VNSRVLVVTEGLGRDFRAGASVVHALRDVDLSLPDGTLTVVHGRSGSGKTTLLNMIGGLDRPTRGRVWVDGDEISAKGEDELVRLRRDKIGFVFQSFGLVPILTAAENSSAWRSAARSRTGRGS